jgi:hypothetical protein
MITITADYGYDVHSISIAPEAFAAFNNGELVTVDGQGFMYDEEGWQQDHWIFDGATKEVHFWLDNGAEFSARIMHIGHGD